MSTVTVTLLGLVAYITLTLVERNSFAFPFNFPMSPISSLSGSELQFVYDFLLRLKRTIVNGESKVVADRDEPVPECSEQQVDTILSLLGSKMEGPQV